MKLEFRLVLNLKLPYQMMEMKSLFLVHSDHDHHHDHDYDRKVQQTHHVKHHSEIQHEKCQNDASHPLLLSVSHSAFLADPSLCLRQGINIPNISAPLQQFHQNLENLSLLIH
ncbi:hypothetical protein FNV43_RR07235 [Rhamnella rubrinervis]|uniref:Uncharacterized protein n=1 Tax=Rhamnella rubrinervis TaxID=2594499 RepID=A0A8K0MM73_9ROSA|nr:hypothetical protein FNV43_RR07235 [Rhamnella rubrinervis]